MKKFTFLCFLLFSATQVIAQDTENPVALCKDIVVQLDNFGVISITAQEIDAGSSDNSGDFTLSIDINDFSCTDLGYNTVKLTVTDSSGNQDTCTAIVVVEDNFSPVPDGFSWIPPGLPPAPSNAIANIIEADQYGILYLLDITSPADYTRSVPYTIDNSIIENSTPKRIAYYLELDHEWIWISMDDFTGGDLKQMGFPSAHENKIIFSNTVTNMNVFSNKAGVVTGEGITTGNVEIWPGNYEPDADQDIGGNSTIYDFDDTEPANTNNGYGSFQIHNHVNTQTLLAINGFNGEAEVDLGIGNNPGVHPDWTYEKNGSNYTTRKLYILVSNGPFIQLLDVQDECSASPSVPNSTDNCDSQVTVTSDTDFPVNQQGTTTITWTFTDAWGNTSLAKQNVILEDITAPSFNVETLPEDIIVGFNTMNHYTLSDFTTGVEAQDNCDLFNKTISISQHPVPGSLLGAGDHNITISATDNQNNVEDYIFTVTVDPTLASNRFELMAFKLYPNPAEGIVRATIHVEKIIVQDFVGSIVHSTDTNRFDVSSLPSGVYFVTVITKNGVGIRKLIRK